MMRFSLKILCVIIFVCTEARDVGDPCRPTQDVSDGQCVLVTDCDVALRHIREKFTHPFRRCGFVRTLEVVCCPKKPNHGVATTKRAITSTTSQSVATNSPLQTSSSPTVPKKLGDRCVPTQNITEGECRLVSDCAIALRAINEQETHPFKRCGFKGKMEIICCPNPQSHPIDSARKEATNYKSTNSTSIAEMSKVSITIADNVLKVSTTKADNASKDFTTIADKQCKKIIEKTLPPISLHIVGGSNAEPGEFPHMVALGYNFDGSITFKCGGALISENFVITAAHCTHSPTRDIPTFVRMGVVHIGENVFNPNTDVKIAKIIIHPDFKDGLKYHDIALLRLERPVDYSETVIPVCLYTGEDIPNVALTITGWGRTSYIIDGVSKMLQKANVTATPQEQCVEDYSKWRKLPAGIARGQFCAGDSAASRDACQGDSGGPLQGLTAGDGYYRLIGITSFGRGCGGLVPGVYTRVSVYREWIESIVWPNEV